MGLFDREKGIDRAVVLAAIDDLIKADPRSSNKDFSHIFSKVQQKIQREDIKFRRANDSGELTSELSAQSKQGVLNAIRDAQNGISEDRTDLMALMEQFCNTVNLHVAKAVPEQVQLTENVAPNSDDPLEDLISKIQSIKSTDKPKINVRNELVDNLKALKADEQTPEQIIPFLEAAIRALPSKGHKESKVEKAFKEVYKEFATKFNQPINEDIKAEGIHRSYATIIQAGLAKATGAVVNTATHMTQAIEEKAEQFTDEHSVNQEVIKGIEAFIGKVELMQQSSIYNAEQKLVMSGFVSQVVDALAEDTTTKVLASFNQAFDYKTDNGKTLNDIKPDFIDTLKALFNAIVPKAYHLDVKADNVRVDMGISEEGELDKEALINLGRGN